MYYVFICKLRLYVILKNILEYDAPVGLGGGLDDLRWKVYTRNVFRRGGGVGIWGGLGFLSGRKIF